nr:methyltransferase [Leucobacter edaphi]
MLRSDLAAANYRSTAITGLIGDDADGARLRGVFAPARRALADAGATPLATLIELLLLGEEMSGERVARGLPGLGAEGARALGLIAPTDADPLRYRAALSLNPVSVADSLDDAPREWWILSDLDDQLRNGPASPQHVMGVGGATRSLIAQLPIGPIARGLDLGTGCGIVALHLALRGPVVATDLSARAITLARANARLNGVSGIEFREGDLFEPVAGEHFDLIASNPPFVVTPRRGADENRASEALPGAAPAVREGDSERYLYRDAGMVGDALAERVVTIGPAFLAGGGTLICLANWESPWGIDALERVREWIVSAEGRLAAWVIERDRVSPLQYAETWARDGGARQGDAEFDHLVSAWLDDFSERRIVALGLGSIRIRRLDDPEGRAAEPERDPGTLVHTERAGGAFGARPGAALDEAFDAMIATDRLSDAEVLARGWILDPAVREEREYRPGESDPRAIALVTDRGLARRATADTLLAAAVGACDGELTLAQIAGALATILEVDSGAAEEALVAGIRELVRLGMITPAPTGQDQRAR